MTHTLETFLEKAKKVHKNKYDYSHLKCIKKALKFINKVRP